MGTTTEILKIESESLKDNYLGDPSTREIIIYRPEKMEDDLPLFIELAGTNWTPRTHNKFGIIMENLINKNHMDAVIVNPNFMTKYGVNQYLNSPSVGNYEDFIIKDLIPFLREKYRTKKTVLFGKSSGGFGAYSIAIDNPGIINAFADHFGDSCFYYLYMEDFAYTVSRMRGKTKSEIMKEIEKKDLSDDDMKILNVFGSSAFYSPDIESEMGFDLPFDKDTGEIIEDIWKIWSKRDPVKNSAYHRDQLKNMDAVYLDVGTKDEYHLYIGARSLHKKLENMSIDHYYEEFNGGHFGNSERYYTSLPYIYGKIMEEDRLANFIFPKRI